MKISLKPNWNLFAICHILQRHTSEKREPGNPDNFPQKYWLRTRILDKNIMFRQKWRKILLLILFPQYFFETEKETPHIFRFFGCMLYGLRLIMLNMKFWNRAKLAILVSGLFSTGIVAWASSMIMMIMMIMAKLSTATLKSHHFVNLTDSKHSPAPAVEMWTICWFGPNHSNHFQARNLIAWLFSVSPSSKKGFSFAFS